MAICYCCFKIQKPFSLSFLLAHRAGEAEPFPEGGYLTHLPPPCTIPQTISSTWPTPSHPTGISIGVPSSRKPSLVPPQPLPSALSAFLGSQSCVSSLTAPISMSYRCSFSYLRAQWGQEAFCPDDHSNNRSIHSLSANYTGGPGLS